MTASQTARQLARAELTRAIKEAATRQLAETGAAALSLRAVARDLGLASSALYRYFPSRDALLTALIIDAFNAIGAAAETAAAVSGDPGTRWLAACRAVRQWALAHPHEFALVYGSPVPGYQAPTDTVDPATRVTRLMAGLVVEAHASGLLPPPTQPLPGPRLVAQQVLDSAGGAPAEPYADLVERSLTLWIALIGTISFELFGHLNRVITDHPAYFDAAMTIAAEAIGLQLPPSPPA
ncbi:AcrR family transcriptional regulator [Kitasatospora gansuensis]|uniref:AcrR family transcriptional regulator n=1 Tax=Kitasatospora gansuensis TaxID=258050 RepID=A0A7W7WFL5_9ACTN|nr:TetR/AcrR family transcriptional regulator [Kitasatospora gansuensis]MBB4944519.1 AcrR family transcriptional regulator [Kitasatospora gansuensis]